MEEFIKTLKSMTPKDFIIGSSVMLALFTITTLIVMVIDPWSEEPIDTAPKHGDVVEFEQPTIDKPFYGDVLTIEKKELPPGYSILYSEDKTFTYQTDDDYISFMDYSTYEEAVRIAWLFYKEKQKELRKESGEYWKKVQ